MTSTTTILEPAQLRHIQPISSSQVNAAFERGTIKGLAVVACSELSGFALTFSKNNERPVFIWQNLGGCVGDSSGLEAMLGLNEISNLIIYGHYPCEFVEIGLRCSKRSPIHKQLFERIAPTRKAIETRFGKYFDREIMMRATEDFVLRQVAEVLASDAIRRKLDGDRLLVHAWISNCQTGELLVFDPEEQIFRN